MERQNSGALRYNNVLYSEGYSVRAAIVSASSPEEGNEEVLNRAPAIKH